jgi:general stress protein YciG
MRKKAKRGFAAMDPETQRAIASKGGKAAHSHGAAHEFTVDEARKAGRKGGKATASDREYMARIGRTGGQASGRSRRGTHDGGS